MKRKRLQLWVGVMKAVAWALAGLAVLLSTCERRVRGELTLPEGEETPAPAPGTEGEEITYVEPMDPPTPRSMIN